MSSATVSLDCLFAVNLCIDLLLLKIFVPPRPACSQSPARYLCGALIALCECLGCIFPRIFSAPSLLFITFAAVLLFSKSFYRALLYVGASLSLGALMTFAMKFLKGVKEMNESPKISFKKDPSRIALSIFLCALLIAVKLIADRRAKKPKNAILSVTYKGKSARLKALRDSGNMLRDPLSGRSVAVISASAAQKLSVSADTINVSHVRIIPVKSVGYTGMLYGFLPDLAFVDGKKLKLCVAIDQKSSDFSGYDAIIPEDL